MTRRATVLPTMPATAEWDRFADLLLDHGPTPCAGRDEWTDDEAKVRAAAAAVCRSSCPLLDACRAAADSTNERFGVFAGTDRTPRVGRPTRPKENVA